MMTEQQLREQLRELAEPVPQETHRAFVLAATSGKDEPLMKRKLSAGLILAMVLIFLTTAIAFAMTNGFGILDFNVSQKDNQAYISHILGIHEFYENDYVSLQVNEAVFDGVCLSLTMNMDHKEGADEVFVRPYLSAESSDGQALEPDIVGYLGGNWHSGFFLPSRDPLDAGNNYGVDADLITDSADGETVMMDPQPAPVSWCLRLVFLHPEYPIVAASNPVDPSQSNEERMAVEAAWMDSFAQAYQQQIIQTDGYGELGEYISCLPREGMEEEAWQMLSTEEKLVRSGAFTLVDTVEIKFTTLENGVVSSNARQTFDLGGGWEAELTDLSVSFARCDLSLLVRREADDGKSALDLYRENAGWEFALLAEGVPGSFRVSSLNPEYRDGEPIGNLCYSATMEIYDMPQALSLLPEYTDDLDSSLGWIRDLSQLTPEQEERLLPLPLS